jgi:broad specificity phosphatase PhoE
MRRYSLLSAPNGALTATRINHNVGASKTTQNKGTVNMGWPQLLVLVRHAESEGNVLSVDERAAFEKSTMDYALTPRGREQTRLTGGHVQDKYGEFDVYYTSYYTRAKETMAIMYPDAKVYEDPRLREGERGIWHMMTRAEVERMYPNEIVRKERDGLYHYRPYGGENWPDIELRIHSFLGTLARDCDGMRCIVVVHGHWLILFQRLIHHFSIQEAVDRYHRKITENASVTVYRSKNDRLVLCEDEHAVPWKGRLAPEFG